MILNNKILERISFQEVGWVFCAKDFHDLSSRNNIDKILSLLAFEKKIMRIGQGIYYYPEIDESGKVLSPRINLIAKAVANNFGFRFFPSGETALKMIGFPIADNNPYCFWTNSKTNRKKVGSLTIEFKHKKIMPLAKTPEAVIIVLCAIMQVGKENIDDVILQRCAKYLMIEERPYLLQMSSRVPVWVADVITQILEINIKM